MKILIRWLCVTVFVTSLLCGMSCPRAQTVAYQTTDALGNAVDKAMKAFSAYEVANAKAHLGDTATQPQLKAWVMADATFQSVMQRHSQYQQAYNAWVSSNAAAAASGGTADPSFRSNAIAAAGFLTDLISSFVPAVEVIK